MSTIACPLNFKSINSHAMRLNTFVYFSLMLAYLVTNNPLFVIAMYLDISWMLLFDFNTAPMYKLSNIILKFLNIAEARTDSGPKKFAWGMAFIMLSFLLLSHGFECGHFNQLIALKISFFTLAETVLNFCMGCFIYKNLRRAHILSAN